MTTVAQTLVKWDRLRQEVEEAHAIDELKDIRDQAEALRQYAKRRGESLDMQNKMAEITLRCSRRMGEMLPTLITHGTKSHDVILSDLEITPNDSSRWQTIARLPEDTFEQHIEEKMARHEELTMAGLLRIATRGTPAALQMSESNEWYTPKEYVNAARELMGGIDLDPASCAFANETVKAADYYDITQNGLDKEWTGRVWLNPPYGFDGGISNQERWVNRLIEQYPHNTTEAVLLVNAVTDRKWFQPLWDFPICFTDHRIRFYNTDVEAGQPTHGNALIYLGLQEKESLFVALFKQFGPIAKRIG